jgi:hypothetical protein
MFVLGSSSVCYGCFKLGGQGVEWAPSDWICRFSFSPAVFSFVVDLTIMGYTFENVYISCCYANF